MEVGPETADGDNPAGNDSSKDFEDDDGKSDNQSASGAEDEESPPDIPFELNLPTEVRRRVLALKKIQVEITKIESKFYEEMHKLECKYMPLYSPLFDKRKEITSGAHEPADDECDFAGGSDSEELFDAVQKMRLEEEAGEGKEKVVGIPDFWLTIFKNVEMLSEMMEPCDEPILKHLIDIKVEMTDKPMGFKLLFHFEPNDFFTNSILTKSYEMKCEMDIEDPFAFEGPEIIKCTGCAIDWAKGKNVTIKTVRKKQKHKHRGSVRTVSKTVEANSFFNFFNPLQVPEDEYADMDEESQMRITNDFEVGQYIRERIVPRAVLYFTGEALEDDLEEEEEEEENEEEEEDEEEGQAPRAKNKKNFGTKSSPECKQQ